MIDDKDMLLQGMKRTAEVFYSKKLKVHVTLKTGHWMNGLITEISSDFFMVDELLDGPIPVFFNQLESIEPYLIRPVEVKK